MCNDFNSDNSFNGDVLYKLGKSLDTLRAPRSMSLAIMILFAFIPILMTERSRIMKAYKVRGGNPHVPLPSLKYDCSFSCKNNFNI